MVCEASASGWPHAVMAGGGRGLRLAVVSASHRTIDLNADLGEGFGVWRLGDDENTLRLVTSANVACGFHAGDPAGLARTRAAAARDVYQRATLQALAHRAGSTVSYVKPHGALYNTVVNHEDQARTVAEAVHAVDRPGRIGDVRGPQPVSGCSVWQGLSQTGPTGPTDNSCRAASPVRSSATPMRLRSA